MNLKSLLVLVFTLFATSNLVADEGDADISFYTGTFDVIDKEGDDQTSLFGIEHKNPNLFRDTFLGKFKPVTGAFMTCLLYTSPSPRDATLSRMPSSA